MIMIKVIVVIIMMIMIKLKRESQEKRTDVDDVGKMKCGWWDKYFEPKSLERNFNGFTFCRELMRKMSLLSTFQSSSWDPNL